jgi:hypothetical protein
MKYWLLFMLMIISSGSFGQKKNTYKGIPSLVWPKLYDITFQKSTDNLGEFDKPVFNISTKSLNGKVITLPGYMVPFEKGIEGTHFMLSSLPLNACFFCGVGGPETVVEVNLKMPVTYTEKPIQIRGTLLLNDKDPDKMIYIINNGEYLGEAGL